MELANLLKGKGKNVEIFDLARCDMSEALSKAFMYEDLVLATTTYNNSMFPIMHDFASRLVEHKIQNKNIGIMEGGTWAPRAGELLAKMFKDLPNIKILSNTVTVLGSLNKDSREKLSKLAEEL